MVLRCLAFTEHFLLVLLPLGLLQDQQCVKHRLCPHNAPGTPQQLGKEDTLAHLTAVCRSDPLLRIRPAACWEQVLQCPWHHAHIDEHTEVELQLQTTWVLRLVVILESAPQPAI